MALDLELAPGYRISEPDPGQTEKEGIIRTGENFTMTLSDTSNLDQSLTIDYGDSNTVTKFGMGLTSQIAGSPACVWAMPSHIIRMSQAMLTRPIQKLP